MQKVKRSKPSKRAPTVPCESIADFCYIIINNPSINLISYSDKSCSAGHVSVYMKCTKPERGFSGHTISIIDFNQLVDWIKSDKRLIGRNIDLRGHISKKPKTS